MKVTEVVNSNLAVILGALFGAAGFQVCFELVADEPLSTMFLGAGN